MMVVVPGYYLVWYNEAIEHTTDSMVVVPGYYLVWYNNYWLLTTNNLS